MGWIRVAAWAGAVAVAVGAFGAHGLKDRLEATGLRSQFETGVIYHMFHVVGLLVVGLLLRGGAEGRALLLAPWLFLGGIVLFSGSLYVLAATGERWPGAVTPVGGLLFLGGWAALAVGAAAR